MNSIELVRALREEADLCRNETATDVAALLDEAADKIKELAKDFDRLNWMEQAQRKDLQCYMSTAGPRWRFGSEYFDDHHPWFRSLREAIDAMRPNEN